MYSTIFGDLAKAKATTKSNLINPSTEMLIKECASKLLSAANLPEDKQNYLVTLISQGLENISYNIVLHTAEKLKTGQFDNLIFAETPSITPELTAYIESNNRDFCMRLLRKAEKKETIGFWFNNGVHIPRDVVALAIHLKSNKAVFEYLNDQGYLAHIPSDDTKELLARAKALLSQNEESYQYLSRHLK